jgi:WD40 repeat protein
LLVAKENAALLGYDIRNRKEIFALRASSALNCCLLTNQHSIVAGAEDGLLIHWDIRYTSTPRNILQRSTAAITDVTTKQGVEGMYEF